MQFHTIFKNDLDNMRTRACAQLCIVKYFQRCFSLPIFIFTHWFLTFYILYFYIHVYNFAVFLSFCFYESKTFFDGAF